MNVTSLPEAETPEICAQTPVVSSAGVFFSMLNVNTTSAGVKAVPSLHLTPGRIVYTSVVELVNLYPVARNGVYAPLTGLGISSGS